MIKKVTKPKKATKRIAYAPGSVAYIIAMGSPKGGAGKSTIGVALAAELARRAEGEVCLLDFDITANSSMHITRATGKDDGIKVFGEHVVSLMRDPMAMTQKIRQYALRAQFLILDTPGVIDNPGAQTALASAGVVILPLTLSKYDFDATLQGLDILAPVLAINPHQVQMVVRNKPERSVIASEINDALVAKIGHGSLSHVRLADTVVRKSVAYVESAATGLPVWALGGKSAESDIRSLCDEVLKVLGVAV